jgi:hypothetical protein
MSTTGFAIAFGVAYALLGIAGLFPAALPGGYLFGLFPMNLPQSALHLAIGIVGFAAASGERYARLYARAMAALFGVMGVLGMVPSLASALGLMPLYGSNIWLHLGSAAIAAYFGWRAEIPVLREPDTRDDRRSGLANRRETVATVPRERRHGAYDRREPLGT